MSDEYSDDAFNEEHEINEAVGEILTDALERDIKKFILLDKVEPQIVVRTLGVTLSNTGCRHCGVRFTARLLRRLADNIDEKAKNA